EEPITTIYSPSHAVEVKRDGERRATVGYESDDANGGNFQLYVGTADDAVAGVALSLLTYADPGSDDAAGYFLLLATPGAGDAAAAHAIPKDVVFVLDTSGSMSRLKLDQAKKALRFCLDNLGEEDRFELVR